MRKGVLELEFNVDVIREIGEHGKEREREGRREDYRLLGTVSNSRSQNLLCIYVYRHIYNQIVEKTSKVEFNR